MIIEEKTEQNNALNSSIVPENQEALNPISLTQTEIETYEASKVVKNTLVSKGHKLHIEDFEDLKRVEYVNLKFLKLLNYESTDTIFARVIGKFPENKSGKPMSLIKGLKDCNENKNQNVYFVVNGGGHKAEEVKVGRALMLEIDKDEQGELIPIDDQYQIMVDKFGIPTVAVFTGNKSLHCYYTYEEPIDTKLWKEMQEDALAYCPIADQSIKDLPRILRLVGFKHSETGDYSRVYAESGVKYSYEELRSRIPKRTVETKKKKSVVKTKKVTKPSNNIVDILNFKNTKSVKDSEPQKAIDYQIDYDAFSKEDIDCLQKIIACLEIVSESDCDAESSWFEITAALKFEALEHPDIEDEIEAIWDKWSSKSVNYDADENYSRWASLNDISDNAITLGTVIVKYCGDWEQVLLQMKELFPGSFAANNTGGENIDSVAPPINFQDKKININTRMFGYIETMLLEDLWFNLHTRRFELDGKEYKNVDFIRYLSAALNHSVSQNLLAQVIEKYEEDKSYHPFEKYLKSLWNTETKPSDADITWANNVMAELVTDIMQIKNDEFAITLVKKWLVGLVSRVLTPGIKFDHVLTLVGGKGLGKTSFFEKIAGEDYYAPHTGSLNDKDTLMKCHKKIVVELGEVEAVFRKTDIEEMKCFITTREDDFRIPYGSESLQHKRRFVLGASANSGDFLREPDGNRRFWIVKVTDKIDFKRVETERDRIMRAACILKAAGERIYLTDAETTINNVRNHEHVDIPLLEEIELVLTGAAYGAGIRGVFERPFLTSDVADALSGRFPHVKTATRAIGNALKALGYRQKRTTYEGKNGRFWLKEDS